MWIRWELREPHAEREVYGRPHAPREGRRLGPSSMNSSADNLPFQLFDHEAEVRIVERKLPHWSQAGAICFIAWRTVDSLPQVVLEQWYGERSRWLRKHGIDPADPCWQEQLERLDPTLARFFLDCLCYRWQDGLDAGHGACVLRQPVLSDLVARSLRHFDEERYLLFDFVVMPNHVHILVS